MDSRTPVLVLKSCKFKLSSRTVGWHFKLLLNLLFSYKWFKINLSLLAWIRIILFLDARDCSCSFSNLRLTLINTGFCGFWLAMIYRRRIVWTILGTLPQLRLLLRSSLRIRSKQTAANISCILMVFNIFIFRNFGKLKISIHFRSFKLLLNL